MEWFKEWIMQIAGIIAVAAVCDIIMIEGGMKKYIKPILGFVLIISVTRPLVGFSSESIDLDFPQTERAEALKFSETLEEKECETVIELYEQKLAEKVNEQLKNIYNGELETKVTAEGTQNSFGNIKKVQIMAFAEDNDSVDADRIRSYVCQEFNVSESDVSVRAVQAGRRE